jgi:hypothetical protein
MYTVFDVSQARTAPKVTGTVEIFWLCRANAFRTYFDDAFSISFPIFFVFTKLASVRIV